MIKEKQLGQTAAIASGLCAEIYGLTILRKHIEHFKDNFTRFFVISTKETSATGREKTSIVFSTRHVPGALHAVLGELAKRKINLTKIESRPIRTTPWE